MKKRLYDGLVEKRKAFRYLNDPNIINPSELEIQNDEHLNAYAYWHGNLNAEILLIGQDFGGRQYYIDNKGKDAPNNQTNVNLRVLFNELGIDIGQPEAPKSEGRLYFTNAVLGAKNGSMSMPIRRQWYIQTAKELIKPLIDIINPEIIIAMGAKAYETIAFIYDLEKKKMKDIAGFDPILQDNKKIFGVYHCSNLGIRNRSFNNQKLDWRKIKEYVRR